MTSSVLILGPVKWHTDIPAALAHLLSGYSGHLLGLFRLLPHALCLSIPRVDGGREHQQKHWWYLGHTRTCSGLNIAHAMAKISRMHELYFVTLASILPRYRLSVVHTVRAEH